MHQKEKSLLDYEDQSSQSLVITLLDQDIELSQFKILKEGWVDSTELVIQAGIIGSSHFVKINHEKGVLYEILSCVDVETKESKLHSLSISKLKKGTSLDFNNESTNYNFFSEIKTWEAGKFRLDQLEAKKKGISKSQINLACNFAKDQQNRLPKTLLFVTLDKINVQIESVHSYPNEDRIVFSQSTFALLPNK